MLGSIAGKCVRAVATKSKVELLDMATEEGAMKTMKVLPVEPQWLGLLRLLPKLVVSSRIVGLHPSAHSLLSKLPLSNDRLDQHLHITPLIAPVSSTEDPGGPIYSSRLFLRLRDGKRYDVAAMLTAWQNASKWEQEQRYLTITESRLRETSRSFYAEAEWPTAVGRRILCESPLSNLSVVFLMPADFRNWLDAIFNRCQELRHSGQAERLRREQLCLGMACLALFLDNYYRAEVVKLCGETVTVFFVDYGNTHEVTAAGVFRATPDLLAIPKLVLFAQELDYAPTDQQSFGLSDGYGDYVAMLKKMVFAELKAGPLLGGYYDVALYTPSWSNRQASLRLMDKLRFEHKCCVNVDAAERRARIMLTPQIDFKQRRPCTHPNSPARFCRLACVVNPRHLYVVGEDEEQPWQSASERLRLTRVASDRIWPGRLLGAAVERRYRRVVVLKVNEEKATADVGLVDNGDRIEVRLDSLVELAPYDAPCRLVRVMLDGVVGNYSFPIDFNPNATSKLNEWLEQKRSVRINWKRVEEVDGVPVFVVDLKADDEDALAALDEQPPIPPVIRKAQSPNSCDPCSSSQQQSCSSLPLSNSPLL
uniref:Tudor domain-containing protein n=1 Tax=Plectus sambesii TaxID=2011161 RepID=A0A914V9L8_9BILA